MKSILQFFAKNRFIAVLAGTVVTGVIQSSSTCTVMVVGFVNAGLLKLTQAIGIIFGANIGTTVTAQIIAFKIKDYALPAIIVGLIVMMLLKSKQHKSWGQTILGFGMLFLGMGIMSKALKVVASYPTFIEFFKTFDCTPIDGTMPVGAVIGAIAIGTAMTVIIQSSSATIGIALTLAASGLINFYTAVPLILGDNIGTTITAVLASLGANRRAKQAACAHFIFNIMGTLYMIALFYVTIDGKPIYLWFINEYMASGDVFAEVPENIARHIAMAHTCFNVFNVLVFLPLIGIIAKICERIVPINDESQERPTYLEPQLLNTPSMAIEQTIRTIRYMTKEAWSMVKGSVEGSFLKGEYSEELAEKIATREEKVDDLQEDISAYLVNLTQKELTTSQSNLIPLLMHCNNDAESIADHSERILGLARRLAKSEKKFSKEALQDLLDIWEVVNDQAKNVIEALNNTDKQNINFAIKDKRRIYSMVADAERKHIDRLSKNVCSVLEGVVFIEMLSELERIGSKFSNIAERAVEIQKHHVDLKSK
jgi:Na/Pi-cotransporter